MQIDRRQMITCAGLGAVLAVRPSAAFALESPAWIAFQWDDGGITLDVTVNGVALRGTLDNGANRVFLDTVVAQRANIQPEGEARQSHAWADTVEVQPGAPVQISVGPYVATVAPIVGPASSAIPQNLVLLGCDLFRDQVIEIDFEAHRLRIWPRAEFAPPLGFILATAPMPVAAPGEPAIRQRGEPPKVLSLTIEGHPVITTLDLGASEPLHLSKGFVDRYKLLEGRRVSRALAGDLGGFSAEAVFSCSTIDVAAVTMRDVPVKIGSVSGDAVERAVVGTALIARFEMFIDMTEQDIWLRPRPASLAKAFDKDRVGLFGVPQDADLNVMLVAPGSPAEAQGWKVGEVIIAVDDKPAAAQGRTWKYAPAGTVRLLTLADGTTRRLVLADYY